MGSEMEKIRHSLSHLLAMAVLEKFPRAKLGIGPVVENGFYYDFDFGKSKISDDDLPKLEKRVKELIKENLKFKKEKIDYKKAKEIFSEQPYKLELIEELKKLKDPVSVYKTIFPESRKLKVKNCFTDLCAGPHAESTNEINPDAFKIDRIAGAYWKGSEKNPMLTRIYGIAFENKKELDEFIVQEEEAKKRDHRKLGQEMELFCFDDQIGPGLPLWLPKGAVMLEEIEKLAKETEQAAGYERVRTPHIAKESLYRASGHLPYYEDGMYPPMEYEGVKYYLKAMNCPHHHKIFASKSRSYRELPLRLAEYGTVYRHEKSGELFGLMRVRMLQMNDAHIYCSKEQFADEFKKVNDLYLNYFKIFGIDKYVMRFSTHDPEKLGEKYINEPKLWKETEKMVRKVLADSKIPFIEVKDEAAFYGPKIDVQIWSAIGKEFSLATNQVDFAVPKRFNLSYANEKGKPETPLCIHRAPLSTHERLIGFLIEHYAGHFPVWLAPVQAAIIPVSEKSDEYAGHINLKLKLENIRAEIKNQNETLGKRIREAELQKIPYIIIVGEKEAQNKTINVRHLKEGLKGEVSLEKFVLEIKKEIESRS